LEELQALAATTISGASLGESAIETGKGSDAQTRSSFTENEHLVHRMKVKGSLKGITLSRVKCPIPANRKILPDKKVDFL